MRRREFLVLPWASMACRAGTGVPLGEYFLPLVQGFMENALATSSSFAVCDFAGGTKREAALASSGKTYVSVSRVLPALAAWIASGRPPLRVPARGRAWDLRDVTRRIFIHAFDPAHPDFWGEAPADAPHQRQVEASLVAWSAWLLRESLLAELGPEHRRQLQAWLASCTRVPARRNNWAWFTAVNHAARLALSERWKEFAGDERSMLDDLAFLDSLALPGSEGLYTDRPGEVLVDYYNFWVFASHYLYWRRMVGPRYPEWTRKFDRRLRDFLRLAPFFFGANGSHVLYGRSLIYRWAVLTPLVLSYLEGLWPHSPGLLRALVRRNLNCFWQVGAFDPEAGKLRETLAPGATRDVCEDYIDNGHPYWSMQAFLVYLVPDRDPFWTAPEEPLPVEREDFEQRFESGRFVLLGHRASGQVRWIAAGGGRYDPHYRDKYAKLVYCSHFPFNVIQQVGVVPWDGTLVFRDTRSGQMAGRSGTSAVRLRPGRVEIRWWSELAGDKFEVETTLVVSGDFEFRRHVVAGPRAAGSIEVIDGSFPLGLGPGDDYEGETTPAFQHVRNPSTGHLVASVNRRGYDRLSISSGFAGETNHAVNIVWPRMVVSSLHARLHSPKLVLESIHYASVAPLSPAQALDFARRWQVD